MAAMPFGNTLLRDIGSVLLIVSPYIGWNATITLCRAGVSIGPIRGADTHSMSLAFLTGLSSCNLDIYLQKTVFLGV